MKKILVTGAAGFIGHAYTKKLLEAGHSVLGIDNLNDYYDVSLKEARLKDIGDHPNFEFEKLDMADRSGMEALFARWKPQIVVNLAAQAGVRYSIDHPHAYVDSNVQGFVNVLEGARHNTHESIYLNLSMPYSAAFFCS